MTRNLKTLGLALIAVLALGATAASGASASDVFTSTVERTDLTGASEEGVNPTLKTNPEDESGITCEEGRYAGTAANGIEELTVHPVYGR